MWLKELNLKEKLIAYLKEKENTHANRKRYYGYLYVYWLMYLVIFIIPSSIFEIFPFLENITYPFKDIPLFKNLISNSIYPDHIVFYVCLMTIISIISIPKIAYDSFFYRVYEYGMFNLYAITEEFNQKQKNDKKINTIFIVFILTPLFIGFMIYSLYFYDDFLNSRLFHANISNLFQTRFGVFMIMLIWQGLLNWFVGGYLPTAIDYAYDILRSKK